MEIDLNDESDILRYSKQFLIKGWGLKEQSKTASIQIDYSQDWNLFRDYLYAMGNIADQSRLYTLSCVMAGENHLISSSEFQMEGVLGEDLQINLKNRGMKLRSWNFTLPDSVISSEVIQLSFFLSLTDSIKSGLL